MYHVQLTCNGPASEVELVTTAVERCRRFGRLYMWSLMPTHRRAGEASTLRDDAIALGIPTHEAEYAYEHDQQEFYERLQVRVDESADVRDLIGPVVRSEVDSTRSATYVLRSHQLTPMEPLRRLSTLHPDVTFRIEYVHEDAIHAAEGTCRNGVWTVAQQLLPHRVEWEEPEFGN